MTPLHATTLSPILLDPAFTANSLGPYDDGSFMGGPHDLTNSEIHFEVRSGEISSIPETTTALPLLVLIALPTLFQRSRRRTTAVN